MEEPEASRHSVVLRGGEVSDFLARLVTVPLIALASLFIATVVQMLHHGVTARYWFLLAGSLAAAVFLAAFGMLFVIDAGRKKKGVLPMLVAWGGVVPYLFGCYLVFYEGLWRLRTLVDHFSIQTMVLTVLFVVCGYAVVNGTYRVSEFGRQVNNGQILIDHGSP